MAATAHRCRCAAGARHRARGGGNLRHLGRPPAPEPRRLVRHEHRAVAERRGAVGRRRLPRRPAVQQRRRLGGDRQASPARAAGAGGARRRGAAERRGAGNRPGAGAPPGARRVGGRQPDRPGAGGNRERGRTRGLDQWRRGHAEPADDPRGGGVAAGPAGGRRRQAPGFRGAPDRDALRPAGFGADRGTCAARPGAGGVHRRAAAVSGGPAPGPAAPGRPGRPPPRSRR